MISKYGKTTIPYSFVTLFLIFLATLNTINAYYYFVFFAFATFLILPKNRIAINGSFFALMLLAISFVIFSPNYSYSVLGMLKPFTYLMCYIMGYNLYNHQNADLYQVSNSFYVTCGFVVAGPFVHYLLNWVSNLSMYTSRNTVDFWTKTVIAATGQAPMACLAMAVAFACIFSNVSKKMKLVSAAILIITLAYNLVLSGRTLFVLALIVLVVAFLYRLSNQKKNRTKYIATTLVVVLAILLVFNLNLFGIRSALQSSPFYERFFAEDATTELDEDGRMNKKINHLKDFTTNMLGGSNSLDKYGFAHELYLDTYDEAGIFALLAVLGYIIATIRRMLRCITNKRLPFVFRQIVLCSYVVLYIQFMTEPILQGVQWLFASFCVIDGCVTKVITQTNSNHRLLEEKTK